MGSFKKRPHLEGNFVKRMEDRLGHKIIFYRPTVLNKGD